MLKKLLCFALVLSLCLAVCPVGALATETGSGDDEQGNENPGTSVTNPVNWPTGGTLPNITSVEFKDDYKTALNKKYDGDAVLKPESKDLILVSEDGTKYNAPANSDTFDCKLTETWDNSTERARPIDAGSHTLNVEVTLTKKPDSDTSTNPDVSANAGEETPEPITARGSLSFTIQKKEIAPVLREDITKSYDGDTRYTFSTRELSPIDYEKTGILSRDYDTVTFPGIYYYEYTTVGEHNFYASEVRISGSPNYRLPNDVTSINISGPVKATITRAAPPSNSKSDTLLVRNRQARQYQYDLSNLLPDKSLSYGTTSYSLHSLELRMGSFFKNSEATILYRGDDGDPDKGDIYINPDNKGQLIVNIKNAPQDGSHGVAIVHINIQTDNYTEISATLNISSDDRTPIKILNLEAADRPQYTGSGILGYSGLPDFKVILSNDELQDLPKDESIDRSTLVKSYRSTANSQSGEYGPTETPPTKPGIYEVTVSIPDSNKDYAGSWKGTFTITKAKVTVRAKDRTIKVDDPVPTFKNPELGVDYTVTGLAPGDTLKTAPTMKYATVADAIMPGEFDILIDGAMVPSNTYYDPAIIYEKGKLIVKSQLDDGGDENPFSDVSEYAWYVTAVKYVYNKGLMQGTTSTLFSPTRTLTRAMLVTILYRLDGEWPVWSTMPFTDLDRNAYYLDAVRWASSNHIVNGYGDGRFGPNDALTREQLAIILYNYSKYRNVSVNSFASLDAFTDAYRTTPTGYRALQWACAEGLIQGTGSTTISPKEKAIRAQVAVILMRYCTNVLNESD